jgi:hypothetical protein
VPSASRYQRPAAVEMWQGDPVDPFIVWAEGSATAGQIAPRFYANLCRALTLLRLDTQNGAFASHFKEAQLVADAELAWHAIDQEAREALVRGFEEAARWTALRKPGPDPVPPKFAQDGVTQGYLERARATYVSSSAERARNRHPS